jgi:hypothetical protein
MQHPRSSFPPWPRHWALGLFPFHLRHILQPYPRLIIPVHVAGIVAGLRIKTSQPAGMPAPEAESRADFQSLAG